MAGTEEELELDELGTNPEQNPDTDGEGSELPTPDPDNPDEEVVEDDGVGNYNPDEIDNGTGDLFPEEETTPQVSPDDIQALRDEIESLKKQNEELQSTSEPEPAPEPTRNWEQEKAEMDRQYDSATARLNKAKADGDVDGALQAQQDIAKVQGDFQVLQQDYQAFKETQKPGYISPAKVQQIQKNAIEFEKKHKKLLDADPDAFDFAFTRIERYKAWNKDLSSKATWNEIENALLKKFSSGQGTNSTQAQAPVKTNPQVKAKPKAKSTTVATSGNSTSPGQVGRKKGWPSDFSLNKLSKAQKDIVKENGWLTGTEEANVLLKNYWNSIKGIRKEYTGK